MAQEPARELMELPLEAEAGQPEQSGRHPQSRISGVLMGVLVQCDKHGQGHVSFDRRSVDSPIAARAILSMTNADVGRQVCLMFEQGNPTKPIILGFMQMATGREGLNDNAPTTNQKTLGEALIDGERMVLEGQKEIVLRCGKASITLTSAGKVLIRGEYVVTRAAGVNRVKGGSVQIN